MAPWIYVLQFFISLSASAAPASYDQCVHSLHKLGGLSLRDSQVVCLQNPDSEVLACQQHLFQVAFKTPQESLSRCQREPHIYKYYHGRSYRGTYQSLPQGQKKVVCSVTVNSKEERESFQKILPAAEYDFVELLPETDQGNFVSRDMAWLDRACEQELRCDKMVFSGHFAESFIGDAGFDISMLDLKKYRHSPKCQAFFESIKDVYLFGCNTLSEKTADHRTISQYVNVLVEDGVSPHTAQRIAARRYTIYDRSVADQMGEIFSGARSIKGFPSVGPTGKRVQPTLEKYLAGLQGSTSIPTVFRNTLGRLGMIELSLKKKSKATGDILVDSGIQDIKVIHQYAQRYFKELPVVVLDLYAAALGKNMISASEMQRIQKDMQEAWSVMPLAQQRLRLCPLLLSGNEDWVSTTLGCQQDLRWIWGK